MVAAAAVGAAAGKTVGAVAVVGGCITMAAAAAGKTAGASGGAANATVAVTAGGMSLSSPCVDLTVLVRLRAALWCST